MADSLNMSNISLSLNTNVLDKVSVSGGAELDPYAINERGVRYNQFNFSKYGFKKPVRLTRANITLGYTLAGDGKINGNDGSNDRSGSGEDGQSGGQSAVDYYKRVYYHPVTGEFIPGGWTYYTNPNVPWSVNFSYSFDYTRSYRFTNNKLIPNNSIRQTLGLTGSIKLSPKMAMTFNSNYDVMAMKMTSSSYTFTYDLHCFNIYVSWIPSGMYESWSFRIAANASALADLLRFKKSSSYFDHW